MGQQSWWVVWLRRRNTKKELTDDNESNESNKNRCNESKKTQLSAAAERPDGTTSVHTRVHGKIEAKAPQATQNQSWDRSRCKIDATEGDDRRNIEAIKT